MTEQTLIRKYDFTNEKFGDYSVEYHRPGVANVELVSFTMFPEDTIYMLTRAYKGIYRLNITNDDIKEYPQQKGLEDVANTKLQTPLEMITTLWLLTDVSRAFTHQLVRYRVGTAFIQESMRFYGMRKSFKVLMTNMNNNVLRMDEYAEGVNQSVNSYVKLIASGVPDQDARGTLPTNILTNIYFHCSFRTLQNIFPQRLCCQAQEGEWQILLRRMRTLIAERMSKPLEKLLEAPYERGEDCGYRASFDRPCIWKNKGKSDDNSSV